MFKPNQSHLCWAGRALCRLFDVCVICLLKHCEIDAAEACRAAVLLPILFFLCKERSSLSLSLQNEGHATPKAMLLWCYFVLCCACLARNQKAFQVNLRQCSECFCRVILKQKEQ